MSISKIIKIFYFLVRRSKISYFLISRFQDAIQHEKPEEIDAEFQLIKKELEIELLKKQEGFQMVDSNYKQKVWDVLFYKRSIKQNIITIATGMEILLFIYLTVASLKFFYNTIKKAFKYRQQTISLVVLIYNRIKKNLQISSRKTFKFPQETHQEMLHDKTE
jgi:hypothetical protein